MDYAILAATVFAELLLFVVYQKTHVEILCQHRK